MGVRRLADSSFDAFSLLGLVKGNARVRTGKGAHQLLDVEIWKQVEYILRRTRRQLQVPSAITVAIRQVEAVVLESQCF